MVQKFISRERSFASLFYDVVALQVCLSVLCIGVVCKWKVPCTRPGFELYLMICAVDDVDDALGRTTLSHHHSSSHTQKAVGVWVWVVGECK